jgi:hypothetical protein
MRSMLLSHEALKPTEWCATGGTVTTFVGVDGKVAGRNRDDDESVCDQIERGTLMDRQRLPGYGEVDVIKWVYKEATGPRKGPAGQTLDPSPAIWWNILVDSDHDLVVGDEGYIEFPGRAPVLVRRKRFENITFPEHVDHRVFTDVPESARDYVVWKPGEPYPPGGEASESKRSSAAPPSVPKSSP